jgi:hypothetical protein
MLRRTAAAGPDPGPWSRSARARGGSRPRQCRRRCRTRQGGRPPGRGARAHAAGLHRAGGGGSATPRRRRRGDGARARAILEEIVHFDYDDSTIRADAQEALARKVRCCGRTRMSGCVSSATPTSAAPWNTTSRWGCAGRTPCVTTSPASAFDADRFDTISMGEDMPHGPAQQRGRRGRSTGVPSSLSPRAAPPSSCRGSDVQPYCAERTVVLAAVLVARWPQRMRHEERCAHDARRT